MPLLDMKTIIVIYFISNTLGLGVMILVWRQNRRRFAGVELWVAGYALQFGAALLMALRSVAPLRIAILAGNTVNLWGFMLCYIGLERFVGRPGKHAHNYALLCVFSLVHAYFTYIQPNLAARIINFSLILLVISAQSAWLLRRVEPDMRPMTRAPGLVFVGYAGLSAARIIAAPLSGNHLFQDVNPFDALVLIMSQTLFIALTFSLFLIVNRRLLLELQTQQAALRESEEKFRTIVNVLPQFVAYVDNELRYQFANQTFYEQFGLRPDEVLGKPLPQIIGAAAFEKARPHVEKALKGEQVRYYEKYDYAIGESRHIDGMLIPDAQGKEVKGYYAVLTDITLYMNAQEALQHSEEQLRFLIENTSDYIARFDRHGTLIFVTDASQRFYGYEPDEILHTSGLERVHPEDRDVVRHGIKHTLEIGEGRAEYRVKRKDGAYLWVETIARRVYNQAGEPELIVAQRDVTDRKQAEQALQASERRLQAILDNSPTVIYLKDPEGRFLLVNRQFEKTFHLTQAEVQGKTDADLVSKEWADVCRANDLHILATGQPAQFEESALLDDGLHTVVSVKFPIYKPDGTPYGVCGISTDITDRKRAEEQVTQHLDELSALHEVSLNREYRILELKQEVNALLSRLAEPLRYHASDDDTLLRPTSPPDSKTFVEVEDDQIPPEIVQKWQMAINLIADILRVPAALIMRVDPPDITVFASSQSAGNPYHPGERAALNTGLYCETVMDTRRKLLVPNALNDERWNRNPDIPLGMISYLGFPIAWPNGDIFGTICALDAKENAYNDLYETLLLQFRDVIETDLKYLSNAHLRVQESLQSRRALLSMLEDARRTEMALQEAQARYRTLFEEAPLPLWEQDLSGVKQELDRLRAAGVTDVGAYLHAHPAELDACAALIRTLDANQTAVTFYRAASKADLLAHLPRIFCEASRPGLTAGFVHIAAGLRVCEHDAVNLTFGGEQRFLLIRWVVAPGHENTYTRVVVAATDITDHKQVEKALQHAKDAAEAANRAKSVFLANMSHELRTPLNGILGYTQVLMRDSHLNVKQARAVETIHLSGEHLLAMISDVLDLAKIEAGKVELQPAEFSLEPCLRTVVEMIRVKAEQKGLTFAYHPEGRLAYSLVGDEKRLRQVLLNLLGNAVKFTLTGEVTLRVHARAASPLTCHLQCDVEDTGIGIPAEKLANIFRPFEQVHDPRVNTEGTGLGLAISAQIVRLMGSKIQVESRPGAGSRFRFEVALPIATCPSSDQLGPVRRVRQVRQIRGMQGRPAAILLWMTMKRTAGFCVKCWHPWAFI